MTALGTTSENWGKAFGEDALGQVNKLVEGITYLYNLITNPKKTITEGMDPRWQSMFGIETSPENKKKWEEKWRRARATCSTCFTQPAGLGAENRSRK